MPRPPKEVTWFKNAPSFIHNSWWMMKGSECIDDKHELLREGIRKNDTAIYRPGPIYWEILRRHPDIPRLCAAAHLDSNEDLGIVDLADRLRGVVDPEAFHNLFYLIGLGHLPWPELKGFRGASAPSFEAHLPRFIALVSRGDHVPVRNPNPVIDLMKESGARLGETLGISSFIKSVSVHALEGMVKPEGAEDPHRLVLEIELLKEELAGIGMKPMYLALHENSEPSAAANAFLRLLTSAPSDDAAPRGKKWRLQPDILLHIHRVHLEEGHHESARALRKKFSEFSFERQIRQLNGEI